MSDTTFPPVCGPPPPSALLQEIEDNIAIAEKKRKTIQNLHSLLQKKNCKLSLQLLELTEEKNKRQIAVDCECEQMIHHLAIQIGKFTERFRAEQAQCALLQERMRYVQDAWEESRRRKNNQIVGMKFDISLAKAKMREIERRTLELKKLVGESGARQQSDLLRCDDRDLLEMEKDELVKVCQQLQRRRDELQRMRDEMLAQSGK